MRDVNRAARVIRSSGGPLRRGIEEPHPDDASAFSWGAGVVARTPAASHTGSQRLGFGSLLAGRPHMLGRALLSGNLQRKLLLQLDLDRAILT